MSIEEQEDCGMETEQRLEMCEEMRKGIKKLEALAEDCEKRGQSADDVRADIERLKGYEMWALTGNDNYLLPSTLL